MSKEKAEFAAPWFTKTEAGKAFENFYNTCLNKSVLDDKTRELLMVALACVFRCPHCTESHIKKALEAGCKKEEIIEALLIAAVEGAGTQLAWKKETFMEYLGR
ncbi:MAG: carboxymuconolactone decarboxylase family protein [Candidatus Omnitrophica bacterium]|nr:carboxymuconolactone decarboxylase family protein [Candidatus Omnitrophota bacterium]